MVDTVLYFEGDRHAAYRILRSVKNRFGSTNEIGVFEMQQVGLVEVENPSEYMAKRRPEGASVLSSPVPLKERGQSCWKSRLWYVRQDLVCREEQQQAQTESCKSADGGTGKTCRDSAVFLRCLCEYRGWHPDERTGHRSRIILAIVSSYRELAISDKTICFGEVGLSGEVRAVNMAKQRVQEAKKLGFET